MLFSFSFSFFFGSLPRTPGAIAVAFPLQDVLRLFLVPIFLFFLFFFTPGAIAVAFPLNVVLGLFFDEPNAL